MANILVVDDRPTNREFLVTLLGYRQHRLLEASDGAEALAKVREHRPDLVITDILMPTMDGYEFVRQLRADPDIAATAVIFYTAHYHKHEADAIASKCGVRHILTKPCEPELILRVVEESLGAPVDVAELATPSDFNEQHLRIVTDKLSRTADDLHISNQRMAALVDINLQLASERDPRQLLKSVCTAARGLIAARYALLGVGTRDNGHEVFFATSGMDAATVAMLEPPVLRAGTIGGAYDERKTLRVANLEGDPIATGLPPQHPPVHALLVAPIVSLAHTYGWICLTDKIGASEFSAEDERLLGILAAQVGRIYENGSLYVEIRKHAIQLEAEIEQRRQIQDALADSELRFRQMAENIRDVFFLVDAISNRTLYVSPAYEEIWGRSRESLYANTDSWTDAIHPEDQASTWEKYQQGTLAGSFEFEYRLVRPDASIRWMKARGFPVRDDAGKVVRIAGVAEDITERRLAERELRESERRLSDMLDNAALIAMILDVEARITYCNEYLLGLTGWQYDEVIGRNWFELFIPPELDVSGVFAELLEDQPAARHNVNVILMRSGARRLIRWNNSVLRTGSGNVIGTASIGEDITDQKLAELRIERLNRLYAVLSGTNALIVREQDRQELFREACRLAVEKGHFAIAWIGVVDGDRVGVPLAAWAGNASPYRDRLETLLQEDVVANTALGVVAAEGVVLIINDIATDDRMRSRASALASGIRAMVTLPLCVGGRVVALFTLGAGQTGFFDEEELKLLHELAGDLSFALDHMQKSEKLDYLAYYDALTNLANRTLFLERVAQHVRSAANNGHRIAVFLVDLERFKNINDSLGQPAGDELLRQMGKWLERNAGEASQLARVGSDHFAVVLPEVAVDSDVASFIETMMRTLMEQPFRLNDAVFRIAAKAGVALFPSDGDSADALFNHAEAALKQAKAHGDRYLFYTQAMTDRVAGKPSMESQLRQALENEEFVLHYQPKVNLVNGKLTGAEALIRWNDPRTGLVPPFKFIPSLEETGLIHDVGRWAMHKAIEDYLRWRKAGLAAVRIAVNVSPLQLRNRRFIGEVEQAVGVDAHAAAGLELEITESMVMEDIKQAVASLQVIRNLGVTIAIDDFGTGFSSLGYLSKLPVDTLKVDRSFVIDMTENPQGLSLVSTIINLAHSLRLKVVGEGVETEEQARLLRLLSCDEMQGYLFSKPVPAEIFEAKFLAPPASAA